MKNYCLITGASSGLGRDFAKKLSKDYNLILVARRLERLEELKKEIGESCVVINGDLSTSDGVIDFFNSIKEYKIEVFINNAGFGLAGSFLENEIDEEIKMIDLNIKALYLLDKLVLKKMVSDNINGYILNVGSIAGILRCGPYMSQYYATKSYVVSLTLGIREELKEAKSNIYIGCLCPGPVDTEFNQVAKVKFGLKGISSDYCTSYAIKKMFKRKGIIIPSFKVRFAAFIQRFVPYSIIAKITANSQKKKLD